MANADRGCSQEKIFGPEDQYQGDYGHMDCSSKRALGTWYDSKLPLYLTLEIIGFSYHITAVF